MKKIFTIALMATLATGMYSCRQKQVGEQKFDWIADRFDDIKVLRASTRFLWTRRSWSTT